MGEVTVSGPGIDRPAPSAAVGISVATTYANQRTRSREEASFYVRDEQGVVVGRADADGAGGVQVYGPAALGREGPLLRVPAESEDKPTRTEPKEEEMAAKDKESAGGTPAGGTPADDLQSEVERVSAKQAAVRVLQKAKEPLKVDEIARRVMRTKGVMLGGKTPEATIAAMLSVENKKQDGLFVRTEKGTYALREPKPQSRRKAKEGAAAK